jgi:tetratricopeptide (TPR) repeat protein
MAAVVLELDEDGARFRHGAEEREADGQLDTLLDQRASGSLSEKKFHLALADLVEHYPNYIDGHAHLGIVMLEHGKAKQALDAYERGLGIGLAAIPRTYRGRIEWSWLENRPFLRAAHGVALCYQKLGRRDQAIEILELMLRWNPSDNQGIRYLIGSEYLRTGNEKKAQKIFKQEADSYPPYRYEAALVELMSGRMVEAATILRRAFIENPYIAEILTGTPTPLPMAIWHGSNLSEPETAEAYAEHYDALWRSTPEAVAFLRWLHTHPKVMRERGDIFVIKEALLWEQEFEKRSALGAQEDVLMAAIDDKLSKAIVIERRDRLGQPVKPWLYPQLQPRYGV